MPKRRDEYKNIGQGEKEKAIVAAVKNLGSASINEVVEWIVKRKEIDLSDSLAKEAFTKGVRTFLRESTGQIFERSFYSRHKDHPRLIEEDLLERDEKGQVKASKYNIKYYLKGSNNDVPGGDLILNAGGALFTQTDEDGLLTVNWTVDKFSQVKKDNIYFVFQDHEKKYISIRVPVEERPFSILIGRGNPSEFSLSDINFFRENLGSRSAVLLWPDRTIDQVNQDNKLGHALIEVSKDKTISVEDLESTNGVNYVEASENDIVDSLNSIHMIEIDEGAFCDYEPTIGTTLRKRKWNTLESIEISSGTDYLAKNIDGIKTIGYPVYFQFGIFKMLIFISG